MTPDKQLTIQIAGRFARVNRRVEELLAPLLTCWLSRFAPGGSHGHRRLQEEQKFYRLEDDSLFFPAGRPAGRDRGRTSRIKPEDYLSSHSPGRRQDLARAMLLLG